jgi:hypothetical protein
VVGCDAVLLLTCLVVSEMLVMWAPLVIQHISLYRLFYPMLIACPTGFWIVSFKFICVLVEKFAHKRSSLQKK